MSERIVLARSGRERAIVTVTAKPPFTVDATLDVQILGTTTWYPATVTAHGDPLTAEVIFAGPTASQSGAVPVTDSTLFRVRVNDSGETVVRGGGFIALGN